MIDPIIQDLNKHLDQLDEDSAREDWLNAEADSLAFDWLAELSVKGRINTIDMDWDDIMAFFNSKETDLESAVKLLAWQHIRDNEEEFK